eukprot:scaffold39479_cov18-Prasinocladus_malaysianus.AAC.1
MSLTHRHGPKRHASDTDCNDLASWQGLLIKLYLADMLMWTVDIKNFRSVRVRVPITPYT